MFIAEFTSYAALLQLKIGYARKCLKNDLPNFYLGWIKKILEL